MGKKYIAVILILLVTLTSCQNDQKDDDGFLKLENVTLADTVIENGEYKDYSIEVMLTKGEYFTEEQTAPGGGIYGENYQGAYSLLLKEPDGATVDEISLNLDWEETKINFPGKFQLCVSDYNFDGYPDFTIGDYASSSMNSFWLYSISKEGKLINIGEFADCSKDFSIYLQQEQGSSAIFVTDWNNALGVSEQLKYVWSEEEGRYVKE